MRMRFKPYAHDELMAADFHVHEPLIWGGKWHGQYARPEQPFIYKLDYISYDKSKVICVNRLIIQGDKTHGRRRKQYG